MLKTGLCTVTEYSKNHAVYNAENWTVYSHRVQQSSGLVYHYSGDSLWNVSCCKLYTSRLDHPGVVFLFPAQQNRQLLETG